MATVRKRPRGCSTITAKHQVTIPTEAFAAAGLAAGESLHATAVGPGRVLLERVTDKITETAGVLTGLYPPDVVTTLRDEWD